MSRWHEECLGRCEDCILSATLCETHQRHSHEDSYKFINIGPVRYGMRLGAVSPPPPGAGSRYRSQTCWQTTPCGDSDCDNIAVSRIPPLTTKSINSLDIISNVNRIRTNDDKLPAQQTSSIVRDHVLHSGKCLLKTQVKRCALVRPQVYTRLSEYGDVNSIKENSTLDRLPRFRFGGNRSSANDKWTSDQRYKELTNRLKRSVAPVPVPPPRSRHSARSTPQTSPTPPPDVADCIERLAPLRCSSFSKADFSSDDKYGGKVNHRDDNAPREISTLPRFKNINRQAKNFTESSQDKTKLRNEEPVSIFQFRAEDIPDISPTTSTNSPGNINTSQDKKRDKSRRRKGIYISQWPNSYQPTEDAIPQFDEDEYIPRVIGTDQSFQNSLAEISRYQTPERDNNVFCSCSAPQEEPLSPEDNNLVPEWPILRNPVEYRPLSRSPEDTELSKDLPRIVTLQKSDSLSEGEPDLSDNKFDQTSFVTSDLSDCENKLTVSTDLINSNISKRYSKRPLRGPYGQMLEAEMKKPEIKKNINSDLRFLEDLSNTTSSSMNSLPKPKSKSKGCNSSLDETTTKESKSTGNHLYFSKQVNQRKLSADNLVVPNGSDKKSVEHQRTSSSPSKLGRFNNIEVSSELLEELLRGSSEQLAAAEAQQIKNDTRTHVVVELYDNERSYVESLEILATKYLEPLKAPENTNLLEANLVDEIFYQIPLLLNQHQLFLEELRIRLENWDIKQKIGDVFLEMFSQPKVIESYTNYVNNWKRAREILKSAQQSKPAFSRFLEMTARQHTGKLALDSLLIKPIQKFPRYELLLQRLIKHTDENHPDHSLLLAAQRQVHDQLLKINCTEKEALELEQLREIEGLIDGLIELATPERLYVRHDSVSMSYGGRPRKERVLFLFSDLLLITSIKRKSGTIKKPITGQGHVTSSLEANKYKLLMRIPLEDIEIVRPKDDNLKQIMAEMDSLTEDIALLNQINELVWTLHCSHTQLEEDVRELISSLNKQLNEQQNTDSQLCCLDLTVSTPNGPMNVSIVFAKAEERSAWEESISEAKQKLAISGERKPCPEIMASVPIRKTRAGLQFTCAAPTSSENGNDVWVCNSDGYVGQLCVLSLTPEPTVTSCNGVCNARILCIASIPGINKGMTTPSKCVDRLDEIEDHKIKPMHFDSSSSSDEDDNCDCEHNEEPSTLSRSETASLHDEETDNLMPTMWLGTEDGCIHVYSAGDNIRIKKNKIKLQLGASILCIAYLENRVFVSLGNGELSIYERDAYGNWDTSSPSTTTIGTLSTPVTKMVPSMSKLWCTCGSNIRIFNTHNLTTENHFSVCNDVNKSIACIILCGNGVWLSLQNSAIVKCYHSLTFELLCEINVAPAVTKMLTSCDDIIRQHKAACLRVTALVSCKDLLWIGTSAGVLLTMSLPHISSTTTKLTHVPTVTGIPHGHTGHVRFLTSVEIQLNMKDPPHRHPHKGKHEQRNCRKLLVISGGDGYEDFRTSNLSEVAGREDSTNHLLLWNI